MYWKYICLDVCLPVSVHVFSENKIFFSIHVCSRIITVQCSNIHLNIQSNYLTVIKLNHHILHIGGSGVPFGHNNSNAVYALDLKTLHWKCHVPSIANWAEKCAPKPKYGQVNESFTYTYILLLYHQVLIEVDLLSWLYKSEVKSKLSSVTCLAQLIRCLLLITVHNLTFELFTGWFHWSV